LTHRYHFDRSKAFYPLVIAYLAQLHGLKAILCFRSNQSLRSNVPEDDPNLQLLGPLTLRVQGDIRSLEISLEEVTDELVGNLDYLLPIYVQAAQTILSNAHEALKHVGHKSKAVEFLRHARNAAAHNGRWHFLNGEPRYPAEWRGIKLSAADYGLPLLKLLSEPGTLELGDPVALLWDIEQEYTG